MLTLDNHSFHIGVLTGPQIRDLLKDEQFSRVLDANELVAWNAIKNVIHNCLGIVRSPNFRQLINEMLAAFEIINVHMSLKIHFLHAHVNELEQQLSTESDEHGEHFHQVAAPVEDRYKGKKLTSMLGELCWNLSEEIDIDSEDEDDGDADMEV